MLMLDFKFFVLYFIFIFHLIPAQEYNVRSYGAKGDGVTSDTIAVRSALAAASNTNGGRVIFDSGYIFLTGCFNVTSNVILDVRGTILGSINVSDYEVISILPWYGYHTDLVKQPFVYMYNATNVTITGGGTIDGNGPYWYRCMINDTNPPCYPYGRYATDKE
uniref:Pectate lyase superfamily protein domain-containing protein n=1 Tax=Acrobeloides nanus TaxID=290746 RepID=A0A914E8B2_9BILA